MGLDLNDVAAVEKALWSAIEQVRCGMVSVASVGLRHAHPMTAFAEPETAKIWFYTHLDNKLTAVGAGAPATLVIMSKNHGLHASITGQLAVTLDLLHRDKYWNAAVSAWFPGGRDDSSLTMLCLQCDEAEVWVSDAGGLRFGWEIAKANLVGAEPNLGGHARLNLSRNAGKVRSPA